MTYQYHPSHFSLRDGIKEDRRSVMANDNLTHRDMIDKKPKAKHKKKEKASKLEKAPKLKKPTVDTIPMEQLRSIRIRKSEYYLNDASRHEFP